jgi:hypothetical protein
MSEVAIMEQKIVLSTFNIPILINKTDFEKSLNNKIDGTIFDDNLTEDRLQITVSKSGPISFSIFQTTIHYNIPLHVWVKKEFVLGGVAAEGDISLHFQTNFLLNPDWTISTNTQITDFQWINKPKANLLGFKIPITSIAERVLNNSKTKVSTTIDQQVKEQLPLKKLATQAWELAQKPIKIAEEFEASFKFTPKEFSISPFENTKSFINCTLFISGQTEIGIGNQLNFSPNTQLAPLQVKAINQEKITQLMLSIEILYTAFENIALNKFKGQDFTLAGRKIVFEKVQLTKEADLLKVRVETSGDYKGALVLKGLPVFDPVTKQVSVKNLEFNLDTTNLLLKSAKWLLNGLLVNKLEGDLTYNLEEDLGGLKTLLQNQLNALELQDGINLMTNLQDLAVNDMQLQEDSILVKVEVNGSIKVLVDALP